MRQQNRQTHSRINWLERLLPTREIVIRSSGETQSFRLSAGSQILGVFVAIGVFCWLSVATTASLTNQLALSFRDSGAQIDSTIDVMASSKLQQYVSTIASMRDQAESYKRLADETLKKNLQLAVSLEELHGTLQQASSGTAVPDPNSSTAKSNDSSELYLNALETALIDLNDAQEELQKQRAVNSDRLRQMNEQQLKTERALTSLIQSVRFATEGLEKQFDRLGFDADELSKLMASIYSGAGGADSPNLTFGLSESDSVPIFSVGLIDELAAEIETMNLYRLAHLAMPIGHPVKQSNRYTSAFGMRTHPITGNRQFHSGADFAAPLRTPIHVTGNGIVEFVGRKANYGKTVIVRHPTGHKTLYAHLSKIHVKKGQSVSRNQVIADMGSTGQSTGSHLHYEVLVSGKAVDPIKYIKADEYVF